MTNRKPIVLRSILFLCFGSLILAFPLYSYMVFGLNADREVTENIFAIHVTIAYWLETLSMGCVIVFPD